MPGRDRCAVWGCDNDRRYPEKQKILHVGVLRFYSPKNKQDVLSWARAINREKFKVTMGTKVCSNHLVQGYRIRNSHSRTLPLFIKGYDCEDKPQRPAPKFRNTEISEKKTRKRRQSGNEKCLIGIWRDVDFTINLTQERAFIDRFYRTKHTETYNYHVPTLVNSTSHKITAKKRYSFSKSTAFDEETTLSRTFLYNDLQCLSPSDPRVLCA